MQTFSGGFFGLEGGLCEGAMWEDLSLEEYVIGEGKFIEKGTGFSSIAIKNIMKK